MGTYEKSQAYPGGYDFYGQQQYGNPPPVQQQFGVVVVNTPLEVGRGPVSVSCPACKAHVTTHVTVETGDLAWVSAAFLCFLSCCLIAWVPFCMDNLKDATHRCPNCDAVIARYKARF